MSEVVTIDLSQIGPSEIWQPTLQLRWAARYDPWAEGRKTKVLQQLWIQLGGKREWRDIPTENEQ
jgi:hypothetical protein